MAQLIILAAGMGTRLKPLTDGMPKCLVPFHDKPLVEWHYQVLKKVGIDDIIVVGGYEAQQIKNLFGSRVKLVLNHEFDQTNMVYSLLKARDHFDSEFIVAYGDIVYEPRLLESLLKKTSASVNVTVDLEWKSYWQERFENILDDAESLRLDSSNHIMSIGQKVNSVEEIQGQYIGLMKFGSDGIKLMQELLDKELSESLKGQRLLCSDRSYKNLYMTDLLQGMIDQGAQIEADLVRGGWLEIDSLKDLKLGEARSLIKEGELVIQR